MAALVTRVVHGLDVNAFDGDGWRPVKLAAWLGRPRALEVLCAAGADMRAKAPGTLWTNLGAVAFEHRVLRCRVAVVIDRWKR